MPDAIHLEAIDKLVAAISPIGDRKLASFLFGRPGAPPHERRFGAELAVDRKAYTRALLFIRQSGATYLRAISMGSLWAMATNFLIENYWHIGGRHFPTIEQRPFQQIMSPEDRTILAGAIARSVMFAPPESTTLYPLIPLEVVDPFDCPRFFLAAPAHMADIPLPSLRAGARFAAEAFPPFARSDFARKPVGAWLGVRSHDPIVAKKIAAAILGALALTPIPRDRYMFSGRPMFGGTATIGDETSSTFGGVPHTPALMANIQLTATDRTWLAMLPAIVDAADRADRKKMRALEYFYRAWFLDPRERFPALCMALDSCVAVTSSHTAEAVCFAKAVIKTPIEERRLRLLMRIRGAVVHGAAPDVYDSENYEQYYIDYGADPIYDLELIVAKCLREFIFHGALAYHAETDVERRLASAGHAPSLATPETIIPANA